MSFKCAQGSKSGQGRWLILFALTGLNFLNYIDRSIFSALLPALKTDLGLTDTELGLLGTGFILAYLVIAPVFGYLGDRQGRLGLMALGGVIWSAATTLSGLVTSYAGQMFARVSVGVGESAYSVIAPSVIADAFSKGHRGKVFAVYSGAVPVGSALGYVLGGWLEPRIGWQKAFFVVGVPGVVLALLLLLLKVPRRGGPGETRPEVAAPAFSWRELKDVYRRLLTNGGLVLTVLGYSAYTFVVGGMAYWMPSYIVRYYDVTLEKGNVLFGAVTVVGGFVGTFLGGWWSDRMERRSGNGYLKVSALSMVVAAPLFWLALFEGDFDRFMVILFITEVALFVCISPLDAAVVNYARPADRSTAMALTIFLIHFLGDGISRALMGVVSDQNGLKAALGLMPWGLVIAGGFWFAAIVRFWHPLAWPVSALRLAKLQAHRGYRPHEGIVENTLEAFRRARLAGAEMFECDVRLSRDGEPVVVHDLDLSRLTGRHERVDELSADELRQIASIPRLSEVLRDPNVPELLNIEIKAEKWRSRGELEVAVVRVVRAENASERVMFSSFNPWVLRKLSRLAPEIPRGFLVDRAHRQGRWALWQAADWGSLARPHCLHPHHSMITEERMRRWQEERAVPVVTWTVNEPERIRQLLGMGVVSVISDTTVNVNALGGAAAAKIDGRPGDTAVE